MATQKFTTEAVDATLSFMTAVDGDPDDLPIEGLKWGNAKVNVGPKYVNRYLGDTILGYWKTYAEKAKKDQLGGIHWQQFSDNVGDFTDVPDELMSLFRTTKGLRYMPDVSKTNIWQRKVLVSRKRTRNLFDLTSLWKKQVLSKLEEDILMDVDSDSDQMSVDTPSDRSDGIDPNFFINYTLGRT
ncbi:hypothetical protein CC1G_05326 [Coprinopsis cinerea okayama7|uniref:Uncharacterized protein n=1 Tax=Coprinopsis cinerea (strain Okayama-7 / 130 / ATCC MYA-4618 / FGSC 9003) TaxID=240176 RepID=A8NPN9_COPC7|nr:hypothetical protein CC1G_05326 [Coprinopsis cinerea okayama7\|eukprot:XP_001835364.2 hypothetical protein CC1G_05326 [Coprinopsis cinerea okayama7\